MFRQLWKLFKRRSKSSGDDWSHHPDISMLIQQAQQAKIRKRLNDNLELLAHFGGPSFDVAVRRFKVAGKVPAALVRLDGLVDSKTVEEILQSLMLDSRLVGEPEGGAAIEEVAMERLLTVTEVRQANDINDMFTALSIGDAVLLFDGVAQALLCDAKGFQTRSIVEPDAEKVLRGPREGFIESLRTNTSLIRRRIRIPHLWIESLTIGELTRTEVAFAYIKGLAREKLVREVRERLKRIKTDSILGSGYLEGFIMDDPLSLFPLVARTERPDRAAAALLEGRVVILVDGSPHVLIVPVELSMELQSPDDYYENSLAGTFIRVLRYLSLLLSLLLPGSYVAIINFHHELLPTGLLLRITATREGVPFPVVVEVLLLDTLFEILREAGVRLPAAIGPAISIVGALILGDAAIRAGLVSPAVVIVIALTAIASFTAPAFSLGISIRILRFVFTIAGGGLGLFGVQFVLLVTVVFLCSLRSFGVPYLTPIAPLIWTDLKDAVLRIWWGGMRQRPKLLGAREPGRMDQGQTPYGGKDPGEGGGEQ